MAEGGHEMSHGRGGRVQSSLLQWSLLGRVSCLAVAWIASYSSSSSLGTDANTGTNTAARMHGERSHLWLRPQQRCLADRHTPWTAFGEANLERKNPGRQTPRGTKHGTPCLEPTVAVGAPRRSERDVMLLKRGRRQGLATLSSSPVSSAKPSMTEWRRPRFIQTWQPREGVLPIGRLRFSRALVYRAKLAVRRSSYGILPRGLANSGQNPTFQSFSSLFLNIRRTDRTRSAHKMEQRQRHSWSLPS